MSKAPILILQMQRMGDMVLTFPLLGWLAGVFPGHPLWVVGEPAFFEPLMPISPAATYFSYDAAPRLAGETYARVINLSHRPEAALLAGKVRAEHVVGPWFDSDGTLFVNGDWQLYRASLTGNNRYNRYHWADLNGLDCIPSGAMRKTLWPGPAPAVTGEGRHIGLFLGASEAQKHPDADFWTALTRALLRAGMSPVLLGGKTEAALGIEVARRLHAPALNLCDRFSVSGLAEFIAGLDLFVCPDTGPLHVAVWSGTPTLNLSLGPVNAWETGPFAPGHHVLRAALPCAGCWQCAQKPQLCRENMRPFGVAAVIQALLQGKVPQREQQNERLLRAARGLELLRSERDAYGLYSLRSLFYADDGGPDATTAEACQPPVAEDNLTRNLLAEFWQRWFGALLGFTAASAADVARAALAEQRPETARQLARAAADFVVLLARAAKKDAPALLHETDFWRQASPVLRPLSGYLHMYLQNEQGSKASLLRALALAERLIG